MRTLIKDIIRWLESGQSLAVATIINQRGSVPRELGAHMAVGEDGETAGTIGGGILEAFVRRQAREVIEVRQNRLLELNLNSETFGADMFCGGFVSILIEYIDAGENNYREFIHTINKHLQLQSPIWLVTWLDSSTPQCNTSQFLIDSKGEVVSSSGNGPSWLGHPIPEIQSVKNYNVLNETALLVERLNNAEPAYIFGCGHIAEKLVPLLDMVGFKTIVIDDRPEYANKERFPDAYQVHVGGFAAVVPKLGIDQHSYVVIITRGHSYDQEVLAQVLRSNPAYLGMIGSKSKRDAIYRSLQEKGFASSEFDRVFSPIGISIGAEGPAEIAISIAAEMIKTRAERTTS